MAGKQQKVNVYGRKTTKSQCKTPFKTKQTNNIGLKLKKSGNIMF